MVLSTEAMRTILIVLVLLHGLIHLMGFLKAYGLANFNQLTQFISKPVGMFWLLISFLFVTIAVLMLLKKEWWPYLGLIAVFLSQILIIVFWNDAKFGTIANIIILLASLSGYGELQFNRMVGNETQEILKNINLEQPIQIKEDGIKHLPTIVQKWLISSGVLKTDRAVSVRLLQEGEMKTSPDGKWMAFTANQYFNCVNPSFVWKTQVKPLPFVFMNGRDKLTNGEGEMLIKLFSMITVVNESGNEKINAASMQRYLAEMCWFPSAAINDYIAWEAIDPTSAKAILTIGGKSVSGIFKFSNEGEILSFETARYYGSGEDAVLEKWLIEMVDHKEFNGIKIPYKCKVTWKLNSGDFNWLNLEITALEYNKPFSNM